MKEKRKDDRVRIENGIAVHVVEPTGESTFMHDSAFLRLTSDISKGGLQFSHSHPIAVDTKLRIHLALDMPRKFVTHLGTVRWNRLSDEGEPASVGVEFTETEAGDMEVWEHFVSTRATVTA